MSNNGNQEQKKENVDSAKNLNVNEAAVLNDDQILYEFVYPGSGNSPGSNCPACGFPHTQESTQIRMPDANTGICPECHHKLETLDHGYFVIYQDDKDHLDITYQWISGKSNDAIPVKKEKLLEKIMTANTIIKSLYFSANDDKFNTDKKNNDKIKAMYFDKLLSLAQAGLTGALAHPDLATSALERLKVEITTVEGQRIKNTYMKELGVRAFLSSLFALMLFFITSTAIFPNQATLADLLLKKPDSIFLFQNDFLAVISMCGIIWIGAMLGTWVSFAARNPTIDFERLSILEADRLEPTIRLIYIGICAIIFALFLSSGIIALEVGGLSTADIAGSISTQFVIGLLCGLTESKIGIFIHDKSETIILNKNKDEAEPKKT